MVARVLGWAIGLSLLLLLATPFARDVWNRYIYIKELYQLSDPVARASLQQRYGGVDGFANDLASRCRELHGADEIGCRRYYYTINRPQ